MPESKVRKGAAEKRRLSQAAAAAEHRADVARHVVAPGARRWVAPTFVTVGLFGVLWLITYYLASNLIPFMALLGNWNLAIGMGCIILSFGLATLWK